jgi:hypothetical protein
MAQFFDAPFKTMFWESVIKKEEQISPNNERFVIYGGLTHVTSLGKPFDGIHERLDIPRLMLEVGKTDEFGVAPLILDRDRHSYIIRLPKVLYQEKLSAGTRDIRSIPVRFPIPDVK